MREQVDRYKALLVKQRDIMIALTGRLNERDEQLLRLQEELEAYDSHQRCAAPRLLHLLYYLSTSSPVPCAQALGQCETNHPKAEICSQSIDSQALNI